MDVKLLALCSSIELIVGSDFRCQTSAVVIISVSVEKLKNASVYKIFPLTFYSLTDNI